MTSTPIDCVLIGHNESDFAAFAASVKPLQEVSAAYADAKTNSIRFRGTRITYMDLMNHDVCRPDSSLPRHSSFGTPQQSVCYLASFLRRRSLRVEVVNLFRAGQQQICDLLADGVRCVAITTTFYTDPSPIVEIVRFIRSVSPDTPVIVGGPFVFKATKSVQGIVFDRLLRTIGADIYVIEAQGELTLTRVVESFTTGRASGLAAIPNLIYRDGAGYARSGYVPENNSLDEEAIDWSGFADILSGSALVRTARSCAFKCSFCSFPLMAGGLVTANVSTVEKELRQLRELGVRYLHFIDDTFNVPVTRFKELCRMMIANDFGFQWTSFFRCGNADDEQIELAAAAGCIGVELGIETASDAVLKNMNKRATAAVYRDKMRRLHEAGIMTYAMLFVGFPGETDDTVQETIAFLDDTSPTFYICGVWYNDTIAPIQHRAQEFGLTNGGYSWKHNTMDWRRAAEWVEYIYRNCNSSTVMPLIGFSFETITYLLGQGVPLPTIKSFTKVATRMMLKSFDDRDHDFADEERMLASLFGTAMSPAGAPTAT